MLYIITAQAAKRRQTSYGKIVTAETACLTPSGSLSDTFRLGWGRYPEPTPDDKRCEYERYRRIFRGEIDRDPVAKKNIDKIRTAVKSGEQIYLTVKEKRKFPNSVRRLLVELFAEHGLGLDIETDRRIDPLRVRDMDPLCANDQLQTTSISYKSISHSDTTNYETVIGAISPEQIARIRAACPNGEFVPYAIGLPPVKSNEIWAEFDANDDLTFMTGTLAPTQETTIEDLTRLFEKSAAHWDTWASQHGHWKNFTKGAD